ncbi:MAG: hypothetical protein ACR2F6_00400 [Mycobacteriales bacterium]
MFVELLVFSGTPNPVFQLDDAEAAAIAASVAQVVGSGLTATEQGEPAVVGYRGFRLSADDPAMSSLDALLVAGGAVVVTTPEGLQGAIDSAGCQDQLIDAARRHDLADILDELGVVSGNA